MFTSTNQLNCLNGMIEVPGDKSISHRSVILGAISHGTTIVHNFLKSNDCLTTIEAFKAMGVTIENTQNELLIHGHGIDNLHKPRYDDLNMGNSGTTTRLLIGLLAGRDFDIKLIGDTSLSKRPMGRIVDPLRKMNGSIDTFNNNLPVLIHGNNKRLKGIRYELPIASAQIKSSIILGALQAKCPTTIIEPSLSRNHTENMLESFSPNSIQRRQHQIKIFPNHSLKAQIVRVPGDFSSAAFIIVAATIVPHSKVEIKNVGINPTRTGLLKVMQKIGADIKIKNYSNHLEPTADIVVKSAHLQSFNLDQNIIPSLIDEVPLLALLAACANGTSIITGAKELRFKESDRIKVIFEEFKKLGISIQELSDGFIINGSRPWHLKDAQLDSHQDHRIAMTLAVARLLIKQPITIRNMKCINISYPNFLNDLKRLSR